MVGIGILETIEKISNSLSSRILTGLLPEIHTYWGLAVGVYILWWLIDRGVLKGEVSRHELMRLGLGIILIETFLLNSTLYHDWIFEPLRHLGFKFTELMIRGGSFSDSISSVRDVMATLDGEMEQVLKMANAVGKDSSMFNPIGLIAWIIMYFFNWFLWFLFFAVVLEYQFCFTVFACLAPLAIGLSFFTATRSIANQIFRLPLFGGLVMGLSSLAMSFVFEVLRHASKYSAVDMDGNITASAQTWVCSTSFHEMVLGLLVGSFLLLKAHGIAGKIAQFDLSVGANVGFAAAAAAVKTASVAGAKGIGSGFGGGIQSYRGGASPLQATSVGVKIAGQTIMEKIRG